MNFIETLERDELIQKIEEAGYKQVIETLLMNESKVYTKKGRLNKSGACRILNMKPKELDALMQKFRDIIKTDQFLPEQDDDEED